MNVTETLSEGLKREFRIVLPAADLSSRLDAKLEEIKTRANLPGFRPGKVPVSYLKRVYGKSVMADLINEAVQDTTRSITSERELKLANEPKITFPEDQTEIEAAIAGTGDLAYTMMLEVLPQITIGDFKSISLVKEVTEVSDADVEQSLQRIAEQNKPYLPRPEGEAAAQGDKLTIDYVGTIDGEAFEGGSAEGAELVLGSKSFIPGFEEQLIGTKEGDARDLEVTFPADYPAEHLAGKSARFAVKVKGVAAPSEVTLDDEFAKTLGLDSLDKLKAAIRDQIAREDAARTRGKVKRKLLDALDAEYQFDLPSSLVDQEFDIIWRNMTADMERASRSFADEGTTEDEARVDYRKIAERRVRLGLLLAEIGERNQIKVPDDEVNRALFERARQFPGQERKVIEFYRGNPQALAELRAPLFEDKVVDFLLELASVTEKRVDRASLFAEEPEAADEAA